MNVTEMPVERLIPYARNPRNNTAAIYAARANLSPLCIEGQLMDGMIPGGQLMFTTDVENYPGFPEAVSGPEMMMAFRKQAERFGTRILTEDGYMAAWERDGDTYRVIEQNCAIWAVAERYGQTCSTEIDFIRAVLPEATVDRVEHMVAGAPHCAYEIRAT